MDDYEREVIHTINILTVIEKSNRLFQNIAPSRGIYKNEQGRMLL